MLLHEALREKRDRILAANPNLSAYERARILGGSSPSPTPITRKTHVFTAAPDFQPPTVAIVSAYRIMQIATQCVGRAFDVSIVDLRGPSRTRHIVACRFALMRLLRTRNYSTTVIGRFLHRDHTTVLSGLVRARTLFGERGEWLLRYSEALRLFEVATTPPPLASCDAAVDGGEMDGGPIAPEPSR